MGLAYSCEFWLEELSAVEPFLIHDEAIHVVVQDLDLSVILGVEDVCIVVAVWVQSHGRADFFRKTFTAFTHVGGGRPDEEGGPVCEVDYGTSLR